MSVGFKIKKLREERNLSQPELANILEISQSDLSKIENGRTKKIDFQLMDRVCKEFDVDFEYFIEERFEAGIILTGSEVKSIRNGKVTIADTHAAMNKNELFCRIDPGEVPTDR